MATVAQAYSIFTASPVDSTVFSIDPAADAIYVVAVSIPSTMNNGNRLILDIYNRIYPTYGLNKVRQYQFYKSDGIIYVLDPSGNEIMSGAYGVGINFQSSPIIASDVSAPTTPEVGLQVKASMSSGLTLAFGYTCWQVM